MKASIAAIVIVVGIANSLVGVASPPEVLRVGKHAAYLWCPDGILKSHATEALLGKAGRSATTRNWATVTKISALLHK